MPKKIEDPESGEEIVVYTQEELDGEKSRLDTEFKGKLDDKDKHVKEKLDQFMKGNDVIEQRNKEIDAKLEEAKRISEEANKKIEEDRKMRIDSYKNHLIEQYVGKDDVKRKAIEDSYALLNIAETTEADIATRVRNAANMSGLNQAPAVNVPFYGSYAPTMAPTNDDAKAADYKNFKEQLGLTDILPN